MIDTRDIKGRWEYRVASRYYRLWGLPFMPTVPYPARAAKLTVDINPFGCWWIPSFVHRRTLSERARAEGETIWFARWLILQISYSRFL